MWENGISPKFSSDIDLFSSDTVQNKPNVSDDLNLMSNFPISRAWISIYTILYYTIKPLCFILFELIICTFQNYFKYLISTVLCKSGRQKIIFILQVKKQNMLNDVQGHRKVEKLRQI